MTLKMFRKVFFWSSFINLRYWGYIFWKFTNIVSNMSLIVLKCESISHGITAPDALLEKKQQKYVQSKNKLRDQVSTDHLLRNLWPKMLLYNFLKFQFGTFIKNK